MGTAEHRKSNIPYEEASSAYLDSRLGIDNARNFRYFYFRHPGSSSHLSYTEGELRTIFRLGIENCPNVVIIV